MRLSGNITCSKGNNVTSDYKFITFPKIVIPPVLARIPCCFCCTCYKCYYFFRPPRSLINLVHLRVCACSHPRIRAHANNIRKTHTRYSNAKKVSGYPDKRKPPHPRCPGAAGNRQRVHQGDGLEANREAVWRSKKRTDGLPPRHEIGGNRSGGRSIAIQGIGSSNCVHSVPPQPAPFAKRRLVRRFAFLAPSDEFA